MNIDREPVFGVLLPKGQNINPVITQVLKEKGINTGEGKRNGSLHGEFQNFNGTWTQADSGNVIGEVERGQTFQAGFVGSDYEADYRASLSLIVGKPRRVEAKVRFDGLFDERTRVSVVVRDNEEDDAIFTSPAAFRNRRFVGRYPSLTRQCFKPYFPDDSEIPVDIDTTITGGEEGFVISYAADGAMVIVKSGATLRRDPERPLRELMVVEEHVQPVFVANEQAIREMGLLPQYEEFLDRLQNGKRGSRRWVVTADITPAPIIPSVVEAVHSPVA